jgi:type II restriction enzyme
MKKDFQKLISTFQESIFTWDYFTNFKKAEENVLKIERELNLLNSLIGKKNIEKEFIDLVREYPKARAVLPILIAVRKAKLKGMPIISNIATLIPENKEDVFYGEFNNKKEKELRIFFNQSGLKEIFQNKNVKNIVDYVFGIEVGMDTNGRKNRTGDLMENIVKKFLENFCNRNKHFIFIEQATKEKIKLNFGYDIKIDKNSRRFDFALFNNKNKKIFLIEVNFYSGGGSKLKATAGEYQKLEDFLINQKIDLIWITDGRGWISSKKSLEETYNSNKYVFNLKMLKDGILDDIVK